MCVCVCLSVHVCVCMCVGRWVGGWLCVCISTLELGLFELQLEARDLDLQQRALAVHTLHLRAGPLVLAVYTIMERVPTVSDIVCQKRPV